MRLPAQTRLSVRLAASPAARAGEIECLIIIIRRRLAANLEEKKKIKKRGHQESVNICLAGRSPQRGCVPEPPQIGRHKSHTLITRSARASVTRRIDTNGGSSFPPLSERGSDETTGRTEGCWDCLLLSCNWINLPSNLFRPVTLLRSHEANLQSPDRVYAQLKLISSFIYLFFPSLVLRALE